MNCTIYEKFGNHQPRFNNLDNYYKKYVTFDKNQTEKFISNRFNEIDEQFKNGNKAEIIFSVDSLKDIKMNNDSDVNYSIHWYWIGEVLKEKYGYVTMERLDNKFQSVESMLSSSSFLININISYFKFKIYKDENVYLNDYNGTDQRFDIFDEDCTCSSSNKIVNNECNNDAEKPSYNIKTFQINDYKKEDKAFDKMIKQMRTNTIRSGWFNFFNSIKH